ncbi:hypothetical protein BN1723_012854, partial [Verticillium longisporum]
MLYYQLDEKEAAVELSRKAIVVSERTVGVDSAETLLNYLNLSLFLHQTGDSQGALSYAKHALQLWKIIYGPDHPDSITTINNGAVMLQHLKAYHESRLWFEESLRVCEKVFGKSSINAATLLFQLAQALALDQDSKGAVKRMRESYNIFLSELGADDKNTKEAESWLEQLTQNAVSIAKHAKDMQTRRLRTGIKFSPRGAPFEADAPSSVASTSRQTQLDGSSQMDSRSIDELGRGSVDGDERMSGVVTASRILGDRVATRHSVYRAHSLLSLLELISPSFESSFKALQEFNNRKDPLATFQIANAIPAAPWIVPSTTSPHCTHLSDPTRSQETYLIAGVDNTDTLRDWNEEFQSAKELPKETVQDRVFRERLLSKLFADYNDAATRGAVLVARGEIPPLNPTECKDAQIFVYNNVFFSFGADGVGTFTSEGGDEAARVATGKDVAGVRLVNQLDVDGLFTTATVVVDYLGKRIVGQSIVPGIFKPREPGENQIDYGAVEGKDIVAADDRFVSVFEKLSRALRVKKHPVWDKESKRIDLEASVETKGLMGTDGRKYVLDLYRVTPLDVAWLEASAEEGEFPEYPHRMTVLRPELVESFGRKKMKEWVDEQLAQRAQSKQDSADDTTKQASAADSIGESTEAQATSEKEKDRIDLSQFQFALNPDAFSGQLPQTPDEKAELEADEKDVRVACEYLTDRVIPDLVRELQDCDISFPMDGQALSRLLHKRGINVRYLDDDEEPSVDHNIHWRPGRGADGAETFLPRTVVYDLKGGFGSLRKINALYDPGDDPSAALSWDGASVTHKLLPVAPTAYQQSLDAGLVPPELDESHKNEVPTGSVPAAEDVTPQDSAGQDAAIAENEVDQEEHAAEALINLTIGLPQEPHSMTILVSPQEQVHEVRQSIIDLPAAFRYTCFHLEHNGERVNDFIPISEVPGIAENPNVTLVEDPYTEKEARIHLVRIRELIGGAGDRADVVQGILPGLSLLDSIDVTTKHGSERNEDQPPAEQPEPVGESTFSSPASVSHLIPPPPEDAPKTIKTITLSSWNPPPCHLKQRGHLLYLIITTNEGEQFQVTAHVGGFYVNKSSNSKFDPLPRPAPKGQSAHSLLSLLELI